MKKINKNFGFTLFELLVSISIIAILVAVATASFSSAQKKARDARRTQDLEMVRKAAEQYYMLSNGNYPADCTSGSSWSVGGQIVLESFPLDPRGVGYTISSCTNTSYCLCSIMEGQKGNSGGSSCNFTGIGGTGSYFCVKNQQ